VVDVREVFGAPLDEAFAALGGFLVLGLVEPLGLGLDDGLGVALGDAVPAVRAAFGCVVTRGVAAAGPASTLWPGSHAVTR